MTLTTGYVVFAAAESSSQMATGAGVPLDWGVVLEAGTVDVDHVGVAGLLLGAAVHGRHVGSVDVEEEEEEEEGLHACHVGSTVWDDGRTSAQDCSVESADLVVDLVEELEGDQAPQKVGSADFVEVVLELHVSSQT